MISQIDSEKLPNQRMNVKVAIKESTRGDEADNASLKSEKAVSGLSFEALKNGKKELFITTKEQVTYEHNSCTYSILEEEPVSTD